MRAGFDEGWVGGGGREGCEQTEVKILYGETYMYGEVQKDGRERFIASNEISESNGNGKKRESTTGLHRGVRGREEKYDHLFGSLEGNDKCVS